MRWLPPVHVLALVSATQVLGSLVGLDAYMPIPDANPLTIEKVASGRRLFFDKRLSRDGTIACATCHDPARAFTDGRTVARGIGGAEGTRNVPTLINRGYGRSFFWDGRARSLEEQVLQPILDAREMGLNASELERRTGMPASQTAAALASYVRSIRSGDAPFDRYKLGDAKALSALQLSGLELFQGKGGCWACHRGPNLSDEQFHNTGVAWRYGVFADEGRFVVSGDLRDRGAFKTPTLREIARTAPYMHDGSMATLQQVVDFYSDGGRPNPQLDSEMFPRRFAPEEKRALVAFLGSLSGRESK